MNDHWAMGALGKVMVGDGSYNMSTQETQGLVSALLSTVC